jgi:hypothetical protein
MASDVPMAKARRRNNLGKGKRRIQNLHLTGIITRVAG